MIFLLWTLVLLYYIFSCFQTLIYMLIINKTLLSYCFKYFKKLEIFQPPRFFQPPCLLSFRDISNPPPPPLIPNPPSIRHQRVRLKPYHLLFFSQIIILVALFRGGLGHRDTGTFPGGPSAIQHFKIL